ncbi:hypothetical protein Tco_1317292 [Tanacetum coccineum]
MIKRRQPSPALDGTFAYRSNAFGLSNAPGNSKVFGDFFLLFLSHLDKMLQRCEDTNLVLNWEKCHFMVKEGIVLGHKISKSGIEVDKSKVDVIYKITSSPTTVKGDEQEVIGEKSLGKIIRQDMPYFSEERIFKKEAKNDQSRARNGKDKVKPKPNSGWANDFPLQAVLYKLEFVDSWFSPVLSKGVFWATAKANTLNGEVQIQASVGLDERSMKRSSTNELFTPYKEPEREFRSSRRHFKSLSLDELRSPDFNLFFDQEFSKEEEEEAMAETMEQYMSKPRTDYGSGVARPKIEEKDSFELKG